MALGWSKGMGGRRRGGEAERRRGGEAERRRGGDDEAEMMRRRRWRMKTERDSR